MLGTSSWEQGSTVEPGIWDAIDLTLVAVMVVMDPTTIVFGTKGSDDSLQLA